MELKIFRDTLPQAGTSCTVKAELPLETEILISDYLPPVFKLVKCFAKPVVLQKQLQPGRLTLEGYLRCTVFYQGEDGAGLCQTEQKLPFTKQLEVPEFSFTSWMAMVEGQTEYLNCRAVNPHRIEVRGAYGLVVAIHTQDKQELITALADGGIEQKLQTLNGVRSTAVLEKLVTVEGELVFAKPPAAILDITGSAAVREVKLLAASPACSPRTAHWMWTPCVPSTLLPAGRQQLQAVPLPAPCTVPLTSAGTPLPRWPPQRNWALPPSLPAGRPPVRRRELSCCASWWKPPGAMWKFWWVPASPRAISRRWPPRPVPGRSTSPASRCWTAA